MLTTQSSRFQRSSPTQCIVEIAFPLVIDIISSPSTIAVPVAMGSPVSDPYPNEVSSLERGRYVIPAPMQSAPFLRNGIAPSSTATQDLSTFHAEIPFRVGYQPILPHTSIRIARESCQPVSGLSPDSGPVLGIPKVHFFSQPIANLLGNPTNLFESDRGPPPEPLVDHDVRMQVSEEHAERTLEAQRP